MKVNALLYLHLPYFYPLPVGNTWNLLRAKHLKKNLFCLIHLLKMIYAMKIFSILYLLFTIDKSFCRNPGTDIHPLFLIQKKLSHKKTT